MKNDENRFLSSDKPQENPEDDSFNYAPLAEKLAKSIVRMTPPEGLVLGIYGEWGLGKSTFIKFIIRYLKDMPKADQPIIVEFNPWWFAGSEHLIRHFFDQFQAALGNRGKRFAEGLIKSIKALSDVVSEIPIPGAALPKTIADQIPDIGQRDVVTLKNEIADQLKKKSKRILVVIDDIDRLDPDEIRQVFTVIKAIADFPNVIYLVAFDKAVVTEALGDRGKEYLEKIVQAPFELPRPSKSQLQELLLTRITEVVGEIPEEFRVDRYYGKDGYLFQFQQIIDTPRKVTRLSNAVILTYPVVKGEVNAAEFIVLEVIRLFYSDLYDVIRINKNLFTGTPTEEDRSYYTNLINKNNFPDYVLKLLKRLFPALQGPLYGNNEADMRQKLKISSPEVFETYFSLGCVDIWDK